MTSPDAKRQQLELAADKVEMLRAGNFDEDAFDAMLWNVASGTPITKWCKKVGVGVAGVVKFIELDPRRQEMYQEAKVRGREVMIQQIITELWEIARIDKRELVWDDNTPKQLRDYSEELGKAIDSVEFDRDGGVKKVTFVKKSTVFDQLAKGLGMQFEHKVVHHEGGKGLVDVLEDLARERFGEAPSAVIEGEVVEPEPPEEPDKEVI